MVSIMFWAKMASLALVTGLSLPPTFRYLRWRRTLRTQPDFSPDSADIHSLRQWLWAEAIVLPFVPLFAAIMARGY